MKKLAFYGIMASLLIMSGAALAGPASLTTQDYVDTGLKAVYKAVYNAVDEVKADKTALNDKANSADVYTKTDADAKFLTSANIADKANSADVYTKTDADAKFLTSASIADKANSADVYTKTDADNKFATKTDLGSIEIETYSAAANGGLKVTNNEFALDIAEPSATAMYVYKNGAWTPLDVNGTFPDNYNFAAE